MRAAVLFVTEINFRLMIRECILGAPERTSAAKASTNRHTSSYICTGFSVCSTNKIKDTQQGIC